VLAATPLASRNCSASPVSTASSSGTRQSNSPSVARRTSRARLIAHGACRTIPIRSPIRTGDRRRRRWVIVGVVALALGSGRTSGGRVARGRARRRRAHERHQDVAVGSHRPQRQPMRSTLDMSDVMVREWCRSFRTARFSRSCSRRRIWCARPRHRRADRGREDPATPLVDPPDTRLAITGDESGALRGVLRRAGNAARPRSRRFAE